MLTVFVRLRKNCIVLLAGVLDGRVILICKVSPEISGLTRASDIIKHIAKMLGGSGGGKPEFAQGSGKDATKIEQAISQLPEIIPKNCHKTT